MQPEDPQLRPETVAVRAGRPEQPGSPLNPPIEAASNFRIGAEREYARGDNTDTISGFEDAIGRLEGGRAMAFASGMAAASAVLAGLGDGATVVAPDGCYQGVAAILDEGVAGRGWTVTRIPNPDTERWLDAVAAGPDLVWLESPSNPMLTVADIPAICAAAAEAGVVTAVDNTFATPLLQRPLDHGATHVVHSATKFIGGHSDLLGGVVVTADSAAAEALDRRRLLGGAVIGALEAFLALRGLRTLPLRLERGQRSATELAARLVAHRAVTAVHYPGLTDDPGYAVARRTMEGAGAVLSFQTVGSPDALDRALSTLAVVTNATSLGGVESTIERRARLSGQESIPATLVRLSVGCEHLEDLWTDLAGMLERLALLEGL